MSSLVSKSHRIKSSKDKAKEKASKGKFKGSRKGKPAKKGKEPNDEGQIQDIRLYCAIYTPQIGNFYHWAFAVNNQATKLWRIFEVVQDEQDGTFKAEQRETNPINSSRCHRPLTLLGQMHPGWWDTLIHEIGMIQVPGEGLSWNCQDYVVDIWDMMRTNGMIDDSTWHEGKENMMPYYGQDFGDQYDYDGGDGEEEEEDDEGQGGEGSQFLSERYVYDSS